MSEQVISRTFSRRVRATGLPLLIAALIFFTCLKVSAWIWPVPAEITRQSVSQTKAVFPTKSVVPAPASSGNFAQERIEAEVITLRSTGFEPGEITRPASRFFILVENRTDIEAVNLQLNSQHGDRLHNVRMLRGGMDWTEMVDLRPGRYTLTEADHPEWVCRITITAR
jgi:hypothetical protein